MKFYTLKYVHCWIFVDCVTNEEQRSNEKVAKTLIHFTLTFLQLLKIKKFSILFNFPNFLSLSSHFKLV